MKDLKYYSNKKKNESLVTKSYLEMMKNFGEENENGSLDESYLDFQKIKGKKQKKKL
jgi:hypothetical protein